MNLTKRQIDIISKYTPKDLKGKQVSLWTTLGYFVPSGANWTYTAGYVRYKNCYVLVVTRFGQVI